MVKDYYGREHGYDININVVQDVCVYHGFLTSIELKIKQRLRDGWKVTSIVSQNSTESVMVIYSKLK